MANRPAVLGNVTVPLPNGAIDNAKLGNMSADTVKGRAGTSGEPQDLTVAQLLTLLGIANIGSGAIISTTERAAIGDAITAIAANAAAIAANGTAITANDAEIANLNKYDHVAASLAALGLNGDGTTDDRATLQSLITARASAGMPLVLPKATYVIDLGELETNKLSIPANAKIIGNGSTWIIKGPPSAASVFAVSLTGGNVTIEDLIISWPATISAANNKPAPGVVSGIFYAVARDNLTLKRVKLHGPGQVQDTWKEGCQLIEMRGCNDVVMEDVEAKWSLGTWGMQLLGGSRHRYSRLKVNENAQDGLKVNRDVTYGLPNRMTFADSEFNDNGAFFQQGQDAGAAATTLTATNATNGLDLVAYYGKRVRLNPTAGAIDIHLPASPGDDGTEIIFSKMIGSSQVTYNVQSGETLGLEGFPVVDDTLTYGTSTSYPTAYHLVRMRAITGGWKHDSYSNGEGVDLSGHDIHFITSEADRNEGGGFQVKPDDNATAHDISFSACHANDQWAGHGFAIVQAIGDGGSVNAPPPNVIKYGNCHASGNRQQGFMFSTPSSRPIYNVSLDNCSARNNGFGLALYQGCRQFTINNFMAIANGKNFSASASHNVIIFAGKGHRINNLICDGVDPTAQDLKTHTTIEAGAPECEGLILYKTYGSGSDNAMDDIVIRGFRGVRHNSANVIYRLDFTPTAGVAADFDSTNAPGVLYFVEDETP